MLEQLRDMILVATPKHQMPTAQFLDADICLFMYHRPIVSLQLAALVRDYVREILDARINMQQTTYTHKKFVEDMKAFGSLSGYDVKNQNPYIISARGAPQDFMVKGSPRTLVQMTAEKFTYARAAAALAPLHGEILDHISVCKFLDNFREEMTKVVLRNDWQQVPNNPATPYIAATLDVRIALAGHVNWHTFKIFIDYDGVITLDVNREGYAGAFTNNQDWLPQY